MRSLRPILLVMTVFLAFQNTSAAPGTSCEGTESCGNQVWVQCSLPIPSLGTCRVDHLSNGIRCTTFNSSGERVDTLTNLCPDGGGAGSACNPGDPFYWVYCDPFAM